MIVGNREIVTDRYFDLEKVSITGFLEFCKNNLSLIFTVIIALFFTYGIKLFWYSIGIDTEYLMEDSESFYKWQIQIGRFGSVLLSKLWSIKEFNPSNAFFMAFCLIGLSTISWCYIIAIFSRDTGKNNKLIPFALVFMTMPIWAEQFYFVCQAAENAFIIGLCPYVIYLLYKGFLDSEKGKIICAFFLLIFITSVYQAIVPLFCCGVFACFVLLSERSNYQPQVYRNLCLKLFITLTAAMTAYSVIDRVIIPVVFKIEKAAYLYNMIEWKQLSIVDCILEIFTLGYIVTIGHIPLVQQFVDPIIASSDETGMLAAEVINNLSRVAGTVLLLPVTVLFLVKVYTGMHKVIAAERRLLYILASIGIPFCIMLLAILGGNRTPLRTLYALPFAFAFMFFYLVKSYKKTAAVIITCFALITSLYQARTTAQLFYSDQMRYNEDVRLAYELNDLVSKIQPDDEKLPVALMGRYHTASRFNTNFLPGEVIGSSFFEWDFPQLESPTFRGLSFIKSLGINFNKPNEKQLIQAHKEAELMPIYPAPGCVKRMQDIIVVRLSATLYDDAEH